MKSAAPGAPEAGLPAVQMIDRGDGVRLAVRHGAGEGPMLLFLPGYQSDMAGTKATHLLRWAAARGRACLLFDYAGCGLSEGRFDDGTIRRWTDDTEFLARRFARGPVVAIGSSMGGWVMLHLALRLGAGVRALVGLAAAPDFTEWGVDPTGEEQKALAKQGFFERPSPYGDPYRYSRAFLADGARSALLHAAIPVAAPARLLYGSADPEVPVDVQLRLVAALSSADIQLTIVKDSDHRLSSPADLRLLEQTLESLGA